MDPNSPGFGMPSPLPQDQYIPATQDDSRVIRVVSRDDSPPPESLPFAQSWGSSSRPRSMPLSQQSRSRSMTDVRGGMRKTSGNLYLHWKKNENKTLPSCQINPRRSPLAGKTCRSPTSAPSMVRKDSNSSTSSLGKHSVDLERSLSTELTSSGASQQRNKSDSGIVSDEFLPSSSVRSGNFHGVESTRHCHYPSSDAKYQSTPPDTQNHSEFESAGDSDSQCNTYSISRFSDAAAKPRTKRQRNHSESEICNPLMPGFDYEYFSDSSSKKHVHRSFESLNCLKDNAKIFPDSFGAPVTDVEFVGWGASLRPDSRTDSTEHLNCGGSWRDSESADCEDDGLSTSWSSIGWRKSVLARCSVSSDGSADDVFSGKEERAEEISDAFQTYPASKKLNCERESELTTPKKHQVPQETKSKDGSSKTPAQSVKPIVKERDGLSNQQHFMRYNKSAKKRDPLRSKSSTHIDVQAENSHVPNQSLMRKSVSDEQLDVYSHSGSSSALLPHLKKTLAAVRRHIKSKKSSGSASKIPVSVRQQISPRQRTSLSADRSKDQSRRSSSAFSTNSVAAEQSPPVSLVPSVTISSDTASSSAEDSRVTNDSNLNSKVLVSTAVTLANGQAAEDSKEIHENGSGSLVNSIGLSCVSNDMSVFSPRPPRLQGESKHSSRPTKDSNGTDSSQAIVESSRLETPETPNKTLFYLSEEEDGSTRTTPVTSPRKSKPSQEKLRSSLREKAKTVSPGNRIGETSTLRKNKRKTSSRVDYILNNDLFRKHLSGHIDLVEKNILHIKKFGLKKSFSNLDLTVTDSERLQAAFESSLKLQNIDLDGSSSDDSKPAEGKGAPKLDIVALSQSSLKLATDQCSKSKTSSDPSTTPRRKSLACDDPSLQQLQEAFRQGKPFSETQLAVTKRSRVHIPSYDEFRKQRQNERATRPMDLSPSLDGTSTAKGNESLDSVVAGYRTLDTITEDDGTDTARSATGVTAAPTVPTIHVEHVEDDPEPETRERKRASVDPPSGFHKSDIGRTPEDVRLASLSNGNTYNEAKQVGIESEKLQRGHSEAALQNKTHLIHPKPKRSSSARNLTIDSNTGTLEREHSQTASQNKTQLTHPKPKRSSSAKNLSISQSEKQATTTNSTTIRQSRDDKHLVIAGFTDYHYQGGKRANRMTGSDANAEGQEFFKVETAIDYASQGSSGSSDGTMHGEYSDGETDPDEVCGDRGNSPGAGGMVEGDNLYSLFDDMAVAMDTEAWSRLFTQTHKSRRREDLHNSKHRRHNSKEDKPHAVPVLRSSSDVTVQMTSSDKAGQRKRRLRKERPYKSDPFADGAGAKAYNDSSYYIVSGSSSGHPGEVGAMRFLEEGSFSRDSHASSFPSLEELTEVSSNSEEESECESQDESRSRKRLSNISTASEDSGVVGQEGNSAETSSPGSLPPHPCVTAAGLHAHQVTSCLHCKPGDLDLRVETSEEDTLLCDKCMHHQQERRDTIYEIIETEINYGRDLRILKEEFLVPMQTTGLLTAEQLHTVFTNLDDLISINTQLTEKLRAALHNAVKGCDQNLNLVNIGSLFVESSTMFLAFESYCINQAQAQASLEQLERERELLRIFLQVSQTENGLLRRMHLKSFLMVPVQRIMKYPLLLNRLYKATPAHHVDKENIRQAREKIEDILRHINAKTKGTGSVFIKRKQSEVRRYSLTEKIEVNRVALEVLGWSKKEVCDLITSRMWYAQPPDHTWAAKRCRNVKFTRVHAVLFTLGQKRNDNMNLGQQAAVVLVREKNGKYQAIRDPFLLDKSVVTVDPDCDDVFELQEWGREAYIFKADGLRETHAWIQHLRQQTHNLGQWRRRRNALPNIMLKNV